MFILCDIRVSSSKLQNNKQQLPTFDYSSAGGGGSEAAEEETPQHCATYEAGRALGSCVHSVIASQDYLCLCVVMMPLSSCMFLGFNCIND